MAKRAALCLQLENHAKDLATHSTDLEKRASESEKRACEWEKRAAESKTHTSELSSALETRAARCLELENQSKALVTHNTGLEKRAAMLETRSCESEKLASVSQTRASELSAELEKRAIEANKHACVLSSELEKRAARCSQLEQQKEASERLNKELQACIMEQGKTRRALEAQRDAEAVDAAQQRVRADGLNAQAPCTLTPEP